MSNINKTSSINDIINAVSSRSRTNIERASINKSRLTNDNQSEQSVNNLKTEISGAIKQFNLDSKEGLAEAREYLIKKMLYWQFSKFNYSEIEISNLISKVTKQINQSTEAKLKLDKLLYNLYAF